VARVRSSDPGDHAGQRHRNPLAGPAGELGAVTDGLRHLLGGSIEGAASRLTPHGFTVSRDRDEVTNRPYHLAVSELATDRMWGLYLADRSTEPSMCLAVPHPRTESAARTWRCGYGGAVPGAVLFLATVHRRAVPGAGMVADQARNRDSVFQHAWTDVAAPVQLPQIQIHGFADVNPDRPTVVRSDVVVSVGGAGSRCRRSVSRRPMRACP
jgi:hypothetical protein